MDIRLVNINKKFNQVPVLRELSLTFKEGKISCIMGPSGSGKTTLINILMGLIKQDSGDVQGLQGVRISAVFQEDRLIEHWDAVRNVQLVCGKSITEEMIRSHLEEVSLTGYEKKPVRELSGGMRRRVAMVRAILAEGTVYILDEPFKGLDIDLKQQVISYIKDKTLGKTVIVITHDPEDVTMLGADFVSIG